jgi:hypothetical protein
MQFWTELTWNESFNNQGILICFLAAIPLLIMFYVLAKIFGKSIRNDRIGSDNLWITTIDFLSND